MHIHVLGCLQKKNTTELTEVQVDFTQPEHPRFPDEEVDDDQPGACVFTELLTPNVQASWEWPRC